jgi:hypothetical protein
MSNAGAALDHGPRGIARAEWGGNLILGSFSLNLVRLTSVRFQLYVILQHQEAYLICVGKGSYWTEIYPH